MKGNRRNISYLMLGQVISVFGGAILRFALSLFVLDMTGRADIFATVLAISSIPVLFAPIGGAIADRYDRKVLMVLMDVCNAIIAALLFLVVGTSQSIFGIGLLIFILAIIGSFDTPVVGASIPLLVEESDLEKINGLSNGILQLSNVVAPIIGGIFYGLMGAKLLVASSVVFFVIAAIIESFLKIPFEKRESSSGTVIQILTDDLKDGFKEVKNNQVIFKSILIAAAVNFVLTSFFIVGLPVILRMTLQVNDTMYGVGMGVFSLASILGAIFAGPLTKNVTFSNFYRVFTYSGIVTASDQYSAEYDQRNGRLLPCTSYGNHYRNDGQCHFDLLDHAGPTNHAEGKFREGHGDHRGRRPVRGAIRAIIDGPHL
ncbi:MAG: hypothetical protein ACFWTP_16325 [Enterococcus gilvus]